MARFANSPVFLIRLPALHYVCPYVTQDFTIFYALRNVSSWQRLANYVLFLTHENNFDFDNVG